LFWQRTQISGEILIFTNSDTFLAGICFVHRDAISFAILEIFFLFFDVLLGCCLYFVVMGILFKFIASLALVFGNFVVVVLGGSEMGRQQSEPNDLTLST